MFLARHKDLGVLRAIKRIPKGPEARDQFLREVNSLKSIHLPGIPTVYDVEEDEEFLYIVEEYVEGESLRDYRLRRGSLSESEILDLSIQICEVLRALHSQEESILYCDLKPENILVREGKVKLVDFGASLPEEGNERRRRSYGTRGYAAPEQYGLGRLDRRSDVFGVGGVMFFLAMGEAYRGKGDDLRQLEAKRMYSPGFRRAVRKCLRHYPVERYESVRQLEKSLRELLRRGRRVRKEEALPYVIAVTGCQRRVGTTHVSFLLAAGLGRWHGKTLYVEACEGQAILPLWREMGEAGRRPGMGDGALAVHPGTLGFGKAAPFPASFPWAQGAAIPMVRGRPEQILEQWPGYSYYVVDYGDMSGEGRLGDRIAAYEGCDRYLVVAGLKPWERDADEAVAGIGREKALFLANLADGFLFSRKCARPLGRRPTEGRPEKWLRVPYVPNPFDAKGPKVKELLEEVADRGREERGQGRQGARERKGR